MGQEAIYTFTVVWAAVGRRSSCRRSAETLFVSASQVDTSLRLSFVMLESRGLPGLGMLDT